MDGMRDGRALVRRRAQTPPRLWENWSSRQLRNPPFSIPPTNLAMLYLHEFNTNHSRCRTAHLCFS
jgi:hypothetical protein